MPLLYYWRGDNYRHDLDEGVGFHLNQASPLMHDLAFGDSLWAFTRRQDGAYVLAAELIASAKTTNPPGYAYGPYRVWGNLALSRYFATTEQPDVTSLIRSLAVAARGEVLGRAFQGRAAVRDLRQEDHALLAAYAAGLALEPRARLVPEEPLEASLQAGDAEAVARLLSERHPGIGAERRRYLTMEAARRDRALVMALRDAYDGACQLCGWAPRLSYDHDLCEAHHVRWLSRGGTDELTNMVLVCPNHHRAIHRADAPFDFGRGGFVFPKALEGLTLVRHPLQA